MSATRIVRLLVVTVTLLPVLGLSAGSDASGQHWSASELRRLERTMGEPSARGVSALPLESFGHYSTILVRRHASGRAELHVRKADVYVVQSGEAELVVGGELVDAAATSATEKSGSAIRGGTTRRIGPGDIVHVPANTPHQVMLALGKNVVYFALVIEAPAP